MLLRNRATCVFGLVFLIASCGGSSPTSPPPPPPPPPVNNAVPVIVSITVQGRRANQPARMADLRETVDVSATVTDAETAVEQLTYQWTASVGTFNGTGRQVTWTAPDSASTPSTVTITLRVVENYGAGLSHQVTATQTVALHESSKEVGDMAVRFLTEFSKPQTNQDWQDIMRDFKAAACPQPGLVDDEKDDVIDHYTNYEMLTYSIQNPAVSVGFGEGCAFRNRPGDACAVVAVSWHSRQIGNASPEDPTSGLDHIAAAYSPADSRWWLCSSDYEPATTSGARGFYAR